jgi:hypothetical protein
MPRALGYVRVSSEEQADSGLGLDAQRQRVRAYCELHDLELATVFDDPGVSGGKPLATRPAGSRLLALGLLLRGLSDSGCVRVFADMLVSSTRLHWRHHSMPSGQDSYLNRARTSS